ncbi:cation diffusion facilitator CzcD-associated flavoprotein CzcO [Sphingomonas endophytica]|uniref:Cation diffusion facilitator CzcD-associated flavoprotein CzcO n=1 Tax=Sphingomonas endophytica TaxID=869719 RepID=A0A7X0JAZ0_9SPHN|nr:NAD(P)/FAD-dependent oxidoreductase [Sphingomonas endophytica]MBB6503527.1 cation diffusion facilitator CzcD-associated flavoprotein CzcO [Sphingomonas endophytica]
MNEHLDVLIVGAGLSGIGAAYRIGQNRPDRRWAIFEARDAIGGTWDLFRYPGIRSDSDMTTLGFPFHPYRGEKTIADGADILAYLRDTARTFGIDRHTRFRHRVTAAEWSSEAARWTVHYEVDGDSAQLTCRFLFFCSGYYDYASGHAPEWPAMGVFSGRIVHPQAWPANLSVTGRRVVVIGSGATAVTLVPALVARGAAHVTMLQRSPTYIVAMPARDRLGAALHRILPTGLADRLTRWKSIAYGIGSYTLARRRPAQVKRQIAKQQRAALGDGYDVAKHLTPNYNPWDQRLCLVPDSDLFTVLRDGRATIVTDTINRFTPDGIALTSGDILPADVVVTATGLRLKIMGGATLSVDGRAVEPHRHLVYKGVMFSDVPNMAFSTGYTNASWTLRSDLSAHFVARLLDHMDGTGTTIATPIPHAAEEATTPLLDLNSGYIQRVAEWLPRQGKRVPWRVQQNYVRDRLTMRRRLDDGVLRFR